MITGCLGVERRLQDGCGENYLVVQRVVVRVHLLGVHLPLMHILHSVQLAEELCFEFEGANLRPNGAHVVLGEQYKLLKALPVVRVSDLRVELGQLLESTLLGFLGEPVVCLE